MGGGGGGGLCWHLAVKDKGFNQQNIVCLVLRSAPQRELTELNYRPQYPVSIYTAGGVNMNQQWLFALVSTPGAGFRLYSKLSLHPNSSREECS